MDLDNIKKWRLILGSSSEEILNSFSDGGLKLDENQRIMDEALSSIYDESSNVLLSNNKKAGKGKSSINLAKWLGDIRTYFTEDVVSVIQSDAITKKGLKQLLYEPETLKNIQPDIEMVSTLISLKGSIPEASKEAARTLVKSLVEDINKRLYNDIRRAVTGALNKRGHSPIPQVASIDWKYTIRRNLKNYNVEKKMLIPERFYFFDRARRSNNWTVIVDMDQSGSMAESVVYGSIMGSIFASMSALNTRVVAFDTEIVDLSDKYGNDPVDMLFGIQLGGGTDINKSVAYCQQFIENPSKTIFILISDLYEGGNKSELVRRLSEMHDSKVKVLCLLALSDKGAPYYDENLTKRISQIGIPCFACTPNLLPELFEGALKGENLNSLSKRLTKK